MIGGKRHISILGYPQVVEYIDLETGEIIRRGEAKKMGQIEIDFSILALQRAYILSQLSPKGLDFAKYVLRFRNARGGISPSLPVLVSSYSTLFQLDRSNVSRLAKQLLERGVLSSDQLCSEHFQLYDSEATRTAHTKIEEAHIAKAEILRLQ